MIMMARQTTAATCYIFSMQFSAIRISYWFYRSKSFTIGGIACFCILAKLNSCGCARAFYLFSVRRMTFLSLSADSFVMWTDLVAWKRKSSNVKRELFRLIACARKILNWNINPIDIWCSRYCINQLYIFFSIEHNCLFRCTDERRHMSRKSNQFDNNRQAGKWNTRLQICDSIWTQFSPQNEA